MDKIQDESKNDREKSSGLDYSANLQYSTSYSYSYYDWAARVLHFSAFIFVVVYLLFCKFPGLIVQFLPAFQSTSPDDFYDDEPYWEVCNE